MNLMIALEAHIREADELSCLRCLVYCQARHRPFMSMSQRDEVVQHHKLKKSTSKLHGEIAQEIEKQTKQDTQYRLAALDKT